MGSLEGRGLGADDLETLDTSTDADASGAVFCPRVCAQNSPAGVDENIQPASEFARQNQPQGDFRAGKKLLVYYEIDPVA